MRIFYLLFIFIYSVCFVNIVSSLAMPINVEDKEIWLENNNNDDGELYYIYDDRWMVYTKKSILNDDIIDAVVILQCESNKKGAMFIFCNEGELSLGFKGFDEYSDHKPYDGKFDKYIFEYKIGNNNNFIKDNIYFSGGTFAYLHFNNIHKSQNIFEKMLDEHFFSIRIKKPNSLTVERVFNIEGIEKVIDPVAKACGRKLTKKHAGE